MAARRPWLVTAAAGAVVLAAIGDAVAHGTAAAGIVPNAMLFVTYLAVGLIILHTQFVRRPAIGGWSLSGLSLGGVFPTCGLAHLAAGLTVAPDAHMLQFDIPGVPASLYFLWVVHRLNRYGLRDWNRRPLVGQATETSRRSPWAAPPRPTPRHQASPSRCRRRPARGQSVDVALSLGL